MKRDMKEGEKVLVLLLTASNKFFDEVVRQNSTESWKCRLLD